MRQRLIATSDLEGHPRVHVPFECKWELLGFLSDRHIETTFHYHATHVTVTFPQLDREAVQSLLDTWAHEPAPELSPTR